MAARQRRGVLRRGAGRLKPSLPPEIRGAATQPSSHAAVAIIVSFVLGYDFAVKATVAEGFAVLADLGASTYRWELEWAGITMNISNVADPQQARGFQYCWASQAASGLSTATKNRPSVAAYPGRVHCIKATAMRAVPGPNIPDATAFTG
jgi:hypothetical protein